MTAPADAPVQTPPVCERCGAAARVHVLEGYRRGEPIRRRLCFDCPAPPSAAAVAAAARRRHPSFSSLTILLGITLATLAIGRDYLLPIAQPGLGVHQLLGVAVGGVVTLVSLLLGAETIALAGALVVGLSLLADVVVDAHSPGIGRRQLAALAGALTLIVVGIGLHRRERRAAADSSRSY